MKTSVGDFRGLPASVDGSRLLVGAIALGAIAIFAALGIKVVPASLGNVFGIGGQSPLTAPFLLSIALVLLAWRRSVDLTKAAAARSAAEERAHLLAYRDDVTGLFNRRFLTEKLRSLSHQDPVTLILLDLDNFKKVNDLYGHAAGDQLLVKFAERMQDATPADAQCVRLGGDEFGILLQHAETSPDEATLVAERLLEEFSKPVELEDTVVSVSASVGISTSQGGNGRPDTLLRCSDIAMYEAKRAGRNRCVWFDPEMERQLNARNNLEAEMRASLLEGHFVPFYQPTLELSSGKVRGFEVLARWIHPTKGVIEPDEFIPVAEATGMISDLSFAVMRTALLEAAKWPEDVTIAVNVSPVQFKDSLLSQRVIQLLGETGFPAGRLELEITESAILEDKELAYSTVMTLKNFGVRISLDDFGTGYASLGQLRELPFDRIKIDRSFVASLLQETQSNAIVEAIATLGKSLNLPITAEGVETESVHQRLQSLGCSDAQGWLWGKALPASEAGRFFETPAEEEFG